MSFRRQLSWSDALRGLRSDRNVVPPGLIGARSRCEAFARFRSRPLYVAGKFDRAAIMASAVAAAREHKKLYGGTWKEALSIALRGAWQAAKFAQYRAKTAH